MWPTFSVNLSTSIYESTHSRVHLKHQFICAIQTIFFGWRFGQRRCPLCARHLHPISPFASKVYRASSTWSYWNGQVPNFTIGMRRIHCCYTARLSSFRDMCARSVAIWQFTWKTLSLALAFVLSFHFCWKMCQF